MILFDPSALLDFPSYGILIPALDSRKRRTFESLLAHPVLGSIRDRWLCSHFQDSFTAQDLQRVHGPAYTAGFFNEQARQQLITAYELVNPDGTRNRWEPESAPKKLEDMVPSLMKNMAGTYRASLMALDSGFCHYLGGGAHHGHRDFGHGFCPVNDTAVTLRKLQAENTLKTAWVIDIDAHKGDGTAAIFQDDASVRTLSIHMGSGWPLNGSLPAHHPSHLPSDVDIPIESGEEHIYVERLEEGLRRLESFGAADFAVVLAGADPWEGDALPSTDPLNLTMEQMGERDRLVSNFLDEKGLPSVWLTAGGYGEGAWEIHSNFLSWKLPRTLNLS